MYFRYKGKLIGHYFICSAGRPGSVIGLGARYVQPKIDQSGVSNNGLLQADDDDDDVEK